MCLVQVSGCLSIEDNGAHEQVHAAFYLIRIQKKGEAFSRSCLVLCKSGRMRRPQAELGSEIAGRQNVLKEENSKSNPRLIRVSFFCSWALGFGL